MEEVSQVSVGWPPFAAEQVLVHQGLLRVELVAFDDVAHPHTFDDWPQQRAEGGDTIPNARKQVNVRVAFCHLGGTLLGLPLHRER